MQRTFLLIVLGALSLLAFFILRPFLVPLSLAAIGATVLYPLHRTLSSRGVPASLSAFFATLAGLICIIVPFFFVGRQFISEAQGFYVTVSGGAGMQYVDAAIAAWREWSGTWGAGTLDASALVAYAQNAASWLVGNAGGFFSGTLAFVADLFLFCMALFFLLRDGPALKRFLIALSPLPAADNELVFRRLGQAVNAVVRGSLFIALMQGFLVGVGLALFGVGNSILWGTVAAATALIPWIGTGFVLVPAVVFLSISGHLGAAAGLTVWGFVIVGFSDNILRPWLIKPGMRLHPLLILLFILGGIEFFGMAGIFLGPLSLSLISAFFSLYEEERR